MRRATCRTRTAGLWHSWKGGWEYEDYSTAMGRGDACPNSAEASRLGWSTPAVGGEGINAATLAVSTPARPRALSFTLPATYLTGDNNYIRLVPDWLASYNDPAASKNLYIAFRVPKVGDSSLGGIYANRLNVHEVNATMVSGLADDGAVLQPLCRAGGVRLLLYRLLPL